MKDVSKKCSASIWCDVTAGLALPPTIWIGIIDVPVVAQCSLCQTYCCNRCAKRRPIRLSFGSGPELPAHLLACAVCGTELGNKQAQASVFLSGHGYVCDARIDADVATLAANGNAGGVLLDGLGRRAEMGMLMMMEALKAPSPFRQLVLLEQSTLVSPDEILAWAQKVIVCKALGFPIAAGNALQAVADLGDSALIASRQRWTERGYLTAWQAVASSFGLISTETALARPSSGRNRHRARRSLGKVLLCMIVVATIAAVSWHVRQR